MMSGFSFLGIFEIDHAASPQTNKAPSTIADRTQVAVPELDRVFLGEAVTAEQLHAVGADLHALLGRLHARERGLARKLRPCSARLAAR